MESLKKSAGDNEELQNQIKQLQEDAAEKEQQYQSLPIWECGLK